MLITSYLIFVGIVVTMFIVTVNMKGKDYEKSNRN